MAWKWAFTLGKIINETTLAIVGSDKDVKTIF